MTTETFYEDPRAQLDRWQPPVVTGKPILVVLPPMLLNILESLCEGKSNRAIGVDWGIAEDTVKTHLKRLFQRLGARDRVHAVVLVLTHAVDVRKKPVARRWATKEPVKIPRAGMRL